MSLLNPTENTQPLTILDRQVANIKQSPAQICRQLTQMWERSFDMLLLNPSNATVAQKLALIGEDARELFERNTRLINFLITELSEDNPTEAERIKKKASSIPAYTVNKDGTVTLNSQ